ncbi:hypothetical protein [Streptomyces sp. NPDC088789]|uniref:hypothetical protein n=1 Tax=Streptomyces sp. NPDC088789 TaxID=3365899 RepID=UPI003816CA36
MLALKQPRGAERRIIAYALTDTGGQVDHTLDAVRRLIEAQGHTVIHELTDVRAPHALRRRPHWREARRLIASGFADGVAVLNRDALSIRDDEYEEEVAWFGERPALLLLVISEAAP